MLARHLVRLGRAGRRLAVLVAAAVLLVVATGASPALAHAQLLDTSPASGADLTTAPATATLRYSEGVRPVNGGIRLFDESGQRLELSTPSTRGSTVTVDLPELGDGAYVLAWRVVSEDGHPVRGAFTFRVGGTGNQQAAARVATSLFAAERGRTDVGAISALLRALTFAAMMLLLGAAALDAVGAVADAARTTLRRLVTATAAVAVVAGAAGVLVYGPYVSGSSLGALRDGVLLDDTLHDSVGKAMVARTVALLVLALVVRESLRRAQPQRPLLLGAGVAAMAVGVAQAASGHGAAGRWAGPSTVATVVHVLGAGAWAGGLVCLLAVGLPRFEPATRADALRRFSTLALWSVAAIVASGLFATARQVGSVDALLHTTMGRLLVAKVALVAGMLALGARNRRALHAPAVLRRVAAEGALAIAVVVLTTLLTGTAPARDQVARPVSVTLRGDAVLLDLTVEPARRGRNDVHLYALTPNGVPLKVEGMQATASLPAKGIEGLELPLLRAGSTHYQVLGADLPVSGTWTITATVRIDTFTEETVSASVTIR